MTSRRVGTIALDRMKELIIILRLTKERWDLTLTAGMPHWLSGIDIPRHWRHIYITLLESALKLVGRRRHAPPRSSNAEQESSGSPGG